MPLRPIDFRAVCGNSVACVPLFLVLAWTGLALGGDLSVGAGLDWRQRRDQPGNQPPETHAVSASIMTVDLPVLARFGGRLAHVDDYENSGIPVLDHWESALSGVVAVDLGHSAFGLGAAYVRQTVFPLRLNGTLPSVYIRLGRSRSFRTELTFFDFGEWATSTAPLRLAVSVPVSTRISLTLGAVAELAPALANEIALSLHDVGGWSLGWRLILGFPQTEAFVGGGVGVSGVLPHER